jgi:hypothetical protein
VIGRPFSTWTKGQKHPRLRLTSLEKTTKRLKGRHHPGRAGLLSYGVGGGGVDGWPTHTHTSGNVGEGWGRILPLAISMSSIKFLGECWVWTMASNTRRGWVHGKHSPIEYANHYTMNGYEKVTWIFDQFMIYIVQFPFSFDLVFFSYLDYLYYTWRHYYTKFRKNNGQENKLKKKDFNCGKNRSTGKGKITGKEICTTGLLH